LSRTVLTAYALLFLHCPLSTAACPTSGDAPAHIERVTNRLELALADGRTVRLAGLDAPDPGRGESETASKARAFLSELVIGRDAELRIVAPRPDRWNRTPADVFLVVGEPDKPRSVALTLLAAGFARVRPETETRDCLVERLAAENSARLQGLGLWTDPYYSVVPAGHIEDLRGRDGLFAIVEGKALRVGVGRSRYYIDFGRRGAFTATIPKRQEKLFGRAGINFSTLAGANLRMRGALDNRFGPHMEITDPQQIERIDVSEGSKQTVPQK